MTKSLTDILRELPAPEPPPGAAHDILCAIRDEQRRKIKMRVVMTSAAAIVSAIALIPVYQAARDHFAATGFFQLVSMAFSDLDAISGMLGQFLMMVLESLPAAPAAALLAVVLAFILSLKQLARYVAQLYRPTRLVCH